MMDPRSNGQKIRVAICGGGIGGLCLAVSLSKHSNVDVQLYEAAGQFKEIGAGVMIWFRTWKILEKMGLADEFSKIAHAPPTGMTGKPKHLSEPELALTIEDLICHRKCIRFHRAQFLDVFVNNLPTGVAHFGKRLSTYTYETSSISEHDKLIKLHFADGTSSICDVLVGADGIKSCIRTQMYERAARLKHDSGLLGYIHPIWTGTMAYRGLIDVNVIPKGKDGTLHRAIRDPIMYCGKSKHVVSYSIAQGDIVNVVTFASDPKKHGQPYAGEWVVECPKEELLSCYAKWEPEVEQLLQCIEKPTKWAIHHLQPLPFYHAERVVLMGDAAHAMAPHQGAGAGQAIEDAFILAGLLKEATLDDIPAVLDAHERVRLPMANSILTGSYEAGTMYEFDSKYGDDYETLGPALQHLWDWIARTTLEEELESALELASIGKPPNSAKT
ncbi:hypothetical protein D9613_000381 [Agrocybe pediades]|uniref:FAD-binding domain-containing protein n=1 Tax=Agrocybe pediades TaxID=84607 RepID=A0A8H4R279_9AGAR|nr:hypothetical protein D9613_000381 [Agrocybe pediades]